LFSGAVHARDRVRFGREHEEKVTAISVFDHGTAVQRPSVSAGEIAKVWGLGEVQKEVIQATLADEYGLDVTFRERTPIYVERPIGSSEATEVLHAETNPFFATIGLRVESAPSGSGIEFRLSSPSSRRSCPQHGRVTSSGSSLG
jgi:translation elongation factor EF-G